MEEKLIEQVRLHEVLYNYKLTSCPAIGANISVRKHGKKSGGNYKCS